MGNPIRQISRRDEHNVFFFSSHNLTRYTRAPHWCRSFDRARLPAEVPVYTLLQSLIAAVMHASRRLEARRRLSRRPRREREKDETGKQRPQRNRFSSLSLHFYPFLKKPRGKEASGNRRQCAPQQVLVLPAVPVHARTPRRRAHVFCRVARRVNEQKGANKRRLLRAEGSESPRA